jgi:hypothetical protein
MNEPCIQGLAQVTALEARAYLAGARDNELQAAIRLAHDRLAFAGSTDAPDEVEIHQALFLLRRARGLSAPSFDAMRVHLRKTLAA